MNAPANPFNHLLRTSQSLWTLRPPKQVFRTDTLLFAAVGKTSQNETRRCCGTGACVALDEVATALRPYGRAVVNKQGQLELISSAAHVGFSFEGTECQLLAVLPAGQHHNYLQYELDGVYQQRLRVLGTQPAAGHQGRARGQAHGVGL